LLSLFSLLFGGLNIQFGFLYFQFLVNLFVLRWLLLARKVNFVGLLGHLFFFDFSNFLLYFGLLNLLLLCIKIFFLRVDFLFGILLVFFGFSKNLLGLLDFLVGFFLFRDSLGFEFLLHLL
jgi:hypothetical protein